MSNCSSLSRAPTFVAFALLLALGGGCNFAPSMTVTTRDNHGDFPINTGAHFDSDCNACHGGFPSFKQFTCVSCHEHSQELTDPVHTEVTGYTWSSTSCYACHPDGTGDMVEHAAFFPIQAGSSHAQISCRQCHPDPANRKVQDCVTCHPPADMNPKHTQAGGYASDSALCVRCHADSQVNTVARHLPFAITSRTPHYRVSCLECHPSSREDKPFGQDFTPFDCLSCHPQSRIDRRHSRMSKYRYESTTCVSSGCHQNGRGD